MIEFCSVTDHGQIREGELLVIEKQSGGKFIAIAKRVLNAGTDREEIVLSKGKNDYFIMSMLLDGSSWVKNVTRLPGVQVTAITNTTNPFIRR